MVPGKNFIFPGLSQTEGCYHRIFEVANHFPLCRAVGVDLVPVEAAQPDNFMEEIWDINRGLDYFYDQYDVVHARLLSHGVSRYVPIIKYNVFFYNSTSDQRFSQID